MQITGETIAFVIFAALAVGGGIGVALLRNLFHAALCLLLALFGVAGLFILLSAPFLAMVQILVYMGAVAILIIFVIMLTRRLMRAERSFNEQWALGALVAVVLFAILIMLVAQLSGGDAPFWDPAPQAAEARCGQRPGMCDTDNVSCSNRRQTARCGAGRRRRAHLVHGAACRGARLARSVDRRD